MKGKSKNVNKKTKRKKIEEHKILKNFGHKNMFYLQMIGVYLPAVNTLSSQVFIPVDISRMTSSYYLIQPCVKFYLTLENKKKQIKKYKQKNKNKKEPHICHQ